MYSSCCWVWLLFLGAPVAQISRLSLENDNLNSNLPPRATQIQPRPKRIVFFFVFFCPSIFFPGARESTGGKRRMAFCSFSPTPKKSKRWNERMNCVFLHNFFSWATKGKEQDSAPGRGWFRVACSSVGAKAPLRRARYTQLTYN